MTIIASDNTQVHITLYMINTNEDKIDYNYVEGVECNQ